MRNAPLVLNLLHEFARRDARVRAVLLTGSRVNPSHPPDRLSDYDVVLSVTDVDSFAADESWLNHFGNVLLMQRPSTQPPRRAWLVVFADGVRIDFTISPLTALDDDAHADSLTRILLDKDGLCPALPPPDERAHLTRAPSQQEFAACLNEFWWVLVYVAKGLWRGQLPYARHTFEVIVRPEMERVLGWYAAAAHQWTTNLGAGNKYLEGYLAHDVWRAYRDTFAGADTEHGWQALLAAAALVNRIADEVAAGFGYPYDHTEAANAMRLIATIRHLDPDAHSLALR